MQKRHKWYIIGIYLLYTTISGGVIMQENKSAATNQHTKAQMKYDKVHTTGFYMKLNKATDEDILDWLSRQESKQGAIKQLIRNEIAKAH